jgi:predicted  nucleic acid-binding Zn-ribbon protein
MNLVFKLYRLQQVDSQLDQNSSRLSEIDGILANDSVLENLRSLAASSSEELKEMQRQLRTAEHDTQAQRAKIQQTETKLYGGKISIPKELQDLQNEAAALKRYLSVLEDRQLDAMLAVDEAEAQALHDKGEFEKNAVQTEARDKNLVKEQTSLHAEVSRLQEERLAASSGVPQETLNLYEALRKKRQGVAVAQVTDQACSACGSTLSSTLLQEARSPGVITTCGFCGRILYAK